MKVSFRFPPSVAWHHLVNSGTIGSKGAGETGETRVVPVLGPKF